jgi:hypothetical protein
MAKKLSALGQRDQNFHHGKQKQIFMGVHYFYLRAASYTAGYNHKDKNHRAARIFAAVTNSSRRARVPNVYTINACRHTLLLSALHAVHTHTINARAGVIKAYCLLYGNNKKWACETMAENRAWATRRGD